MDGLTINIIKGESERQIPAHECPDCGGTCKDEDGDPCYTCEGEGLLPDMKPELEHDWRTN